MNLVVSHSGLSRLSTITQIMSYDPVKAPTSWTDRIPVIPNWARGTALAAVLVAALIGIYEIGHVLLAPTHHLLGSMQGVSLALWSLAMLGVLGGLVALSGAHTSLVSYRNTERRVDLEILPEDERRILEPILETPGITQVEVVSRSDFSDAKVSQTLKALRERGLIYREPQGRTYRLYPGTVLSEATDEA